MTMSLRQIKRRLEKIKRDRDRKKQLSCDICGNEMVMIRGKHPGEPKRAVCPVCLQERLEFIHDYTNPNYGIAGQERNR